MADTLAIERVDRSRHQLAIALRVDDLRFHITYWYGDVDLHALESEHGAAVCDKLYFHIAAFEAAKLASLRPRVFDLGPFAHHHTEAFETLWRTVFRNVWGQWRYEHVLPDYDGPELASTAAATGAPPAGVRPGSVEVLAFCGGGKDSLVQAKLLERAGIAHASLAYSSSVYGRAAPQHELIDGLLDRCDPKRRHKLWMYDDILDSPVVALHPEHGVKSLTAAETPASIFAALPIVLAHGYQYMALAHEASANVGNLTWDITGEEINHQWGKSLVAERLLNDYVHAELLHNATYFSTLQPVHDTLIFNLLNRDLGSVPFTHSCNVRKPWCGRCAKCAYVWLGYMAYLPTSRVEPLFDRNLLAVGDNMPHYRAMLGLTDHTPFECIGQIDEARLAFAVCRHKGFEGAAMDMFSSEVPALDVADILDRYLAVDDSAANIPPDIASGIMPQLHEAADNARDYIERILSQ